MTRTRKLVLLCVGVLSLSIQNALATAATAASSIEEEKAKSITRPNNLRSGDISASRRLDGTVGIIEPGEEAETVTAPAVKSTSTTVKKPTKKKKQPVKDPAALSTTSQKVLSPNATTPKESSATLPSAKLDTGNEPNDTTSAIKPAVDTCGTAKTCDECFEQAKSLNLDTTNQSSCNWAGEGEGVCSSAIYDADNILSCSVAVEGMQKSQSKDSTSGDSGSLMLILVILSFVGGGYVFRKRIIGKLRERTGGMVGDIEFGGGSAGSSNLRHETIPLASNEDEWGWEDGNNSISSSPTMEEQRRNEKEDLEMAMALSLSQKHSPSSPSEEIKDVTREPPVSRSAFSKPTPRAPPSAKPFTKPTSPRPIRPKKDAISSISKPKKKDKGMEDIFASMGISAKPTFEKQHSPPINPSSSGYGHKSTLASAAEDLDDYDSSNNWDDDDDLDDLLEG